MPTSKVAPVVGARHTNASGVTGEWNGSTWVKVVDAADTPAPERSWTDAAISTGLRVVPAMLGGIAGGAFGSVVPVAGTTVGAAAGSAAGGALGAYLDELYQGQDANATDIITSGVLNAIPTGKYVAGAGKAVLRTIAPGVERRLAGMLAPEAASVGAGLLDRINPKELAKTVAKSAATGAVVAPLENTGVRITQGQPTTGKELLQEATMGTLLGGATPLAVKAAQVPFRVVARTVDSGLPAWLRKSESIDTAALQAERAGQRQKGRPETRQTNKTLAALGTTGNIAEQQDQVLSQVNTANANVRMAVSASDVKNINLSNSADLVRRLDKMADHFDQQDLGATDAGTARRLATAVRGKATISPEDALDLKQFLDKNRSSGSYTVDPQNATAAKGMKDLSDSIRNDLKSQLPGIAKALDFAHAGYDALGDLYKKGASNANASPDASLFMQGARVVARPRVRARTANIINKLAGNTFESAPDVAPLPKRPIVDGDSGPSTGPSAPPPSSPRTPPGLGSTAAPPPNSGGGTATPPPGQSAPPPRSGPTGGANSQAADDTANAAASAAEARRQAEATAREARRAEDRRKTAEDSRKRAEYDAGEPARKAERERQAEAGRQSREKARKRAEDAARQRAAEEARRRSQEQQRQNQSRQRQGGQQQGGPRRTAGPDPYTVLGVPRTATDAQIRTAYMDLIKQYHPDKMAGTMGDMLNPEAKKARMAEATARTQAINSAYTSLKKPKR